MKQTLCSLVMLPCDPSDWLVIDPAVACHRFRLTSSWPLRRMLECTKSPVNAASAVQSYMGLYQIQIGFGRHTYLKAWRFFVLFSLTCIGRYSRSHHAATKLECAV